MRILFTTKVFPPFQLDGTLYFADIALRLKEMGHDVKVMMLDFPIEKSYVWNGLDVFGDSGNDSQWNWGEVIFTHLHATNWTIYKAGNKRVYHVLHSEQPASYNIQLKDAPSNHVMVYNSTFLKMHFNFKHSCITLNPPTSVTKYNVCDDPEKNPAITLISLNGMKGGHIFYKIAKAMPERQFIGVIGSAGTQIIENHPNVKIIPNTPNILDVYKQTKLLLMPSQFESWGKTATEAMCNGIPVICTETPGLKENCGKSAIYIKERDNIEEWVHAITMQRPMVYRMKSKMCRERAIELEEMNNKQFQNLNHVLTNTNKNVKLFF